MIEIILAIDIIDAKCVRLSQGDFSRVKTYSADPVSIAQWFESYGLKRVHLVDLDGAKTGSVANLKVLEAIATKTDLKIDFGGGLKNMEDIRRVFEAGASIATVGSLAVRDPSLMSRILHMYGSQKILLGADVRHRRLAIDGWQTETALEIEPFLSEYSAGGGRQVFVTDIKRDGLLGGPSIDLYKTIAEKVPRVDLIASGGIATMNDIDELENIGCKGAIIGKAVYEGKISLERLAGRNRQTATHL